MSATSVRGDIYPQFTPADSGLDQTHDRERSDDVMKIIRF